jgi:hypothetical protein
VRIDHVIYANADLDTAPSYGEADERNGRNEAYAGARSAGASLLLASEAGL